MIKPFPTIQDTLIPSVVFEEAGRHKVYDRMHFAREMAQYCHKKTRITGIRETIDGLNTYKLYELEGCQEWTWVDDSF